MKAEVRPQELTVLSEYLNPAQRALFVGMSRSDQRHSLDLFYKLREAGEIDEALLQAALLHDVGKSLGRIGLWQRVAYVLLGKVSRRWRARFCAKPQRGWRHAFFVLAHHTQLGAEMARQAGCSEEVIALIREHQAPVTSIIPLPSQRKLRVLQAADDQ